jgi:hypothetical protein
MIESGGKIMTAKIITIVFVMLLISMESPTTTQAHHTQDMQEMKEMPMMKSDGPVAALQCEPVDIMAGNPETITIFVKDSAGNPEKGLTRTHDRIMHVVIASRDFSVFSHIHPEDFGPITDEMKTTVQYPVRYTFPKSGRYIVGIDFAVNDQAYSKHFSIDVAGGPEMAAPEKDLSRRKIFGAYDVSLTTMPDTISAGKETMLTYRFMEDERPVTDLEPYIAAIMHVAVISTDFRQFIHEHGFVPGMPIMEMGGHHMMHEMSLPSAFGPEIKVPVTFPAAGVYKIFGEVKHKGKVIVTNFMVEVK